MEITTAQPSDIPQIVDIHLRAFEGFFLTSLGPHFLRLYYDSVRTYQGGVLFKCVNQGQTIGFCAAALHSAGFNKHLVKHRLADYILMGGRLAFTRPQALWRLFLNFSKEDADHGDTGDYAELLSIGVDPNVQRSGAGKQLSLTTDYDDNDKAIGFYRALGYHEWYDFVTYPQRRMYRMIKTLQP